MKISLERFRLFLFLSLIAWMAWITFCILSLHGQSIPTTKQELVNNYVSPSHQRSKANTNQTPPPPKWDISSIDPRSVPLSAYIEKYQYYTSHEPPTEPMTDSFEAPRPPGEFIIPLPLRTQSPESLRRVTYPKVSSCTDLPHNLPVDPGYATRRSDGKFVMTVVKNVDVIYPDLLEERLEYTPVDSDPFLPWIHDVFSSDDGTKINFISQNKRRCHTGSKFFRDIWNLEAQVAIMQPVALKRVKDVPKALWDDGVEEERFQLSSLEEADDDGRETRFLCHFHGGTTYSNVTLSRYHFNLEWINWRKRMDSMLTSCGRDNSQFWLSTQQFYCPVPDELVDGVLSGDVEGRVQLDLIPVRAPPRFGEIFVDQLKEYEFNTFNATKMWAGHVLPKMEASGRWANLPICRPPPAAPSSSTSSIQEISTRDKSTKKHFLVGCLWVSSTYATRNDDAHISDIPRRLLEWIEFHLMVGFDHFYLYDNSLGNDINGNNSILALLVDIFGPDKITYISWPFRVCNNNNNNDENKGERSSQYAAESSCRERYGGRTEWMTTFDPDEYLVPTGNYNNLQDLLIDVKRKEPHIDILSFQCTRAHMRYDHLMPFYDSNDCSTNSSQSSIPNCLTIDPAKTLLQAFNCESHHRPGKIPYVDVCAKKQIYRPAYVLYHFIHYSPVTQTFFEIPERRRQPREQHERDTKELEEAIMIHAKTRPLPVKMSLLEMCRRNLCFNVGFARPENHNEDDKYNKDGFMYSCWRQQRVDEFWVPKLVQAMSERFSNATQMITDYLDV